MKAIQVDGEDLVWADFAPSACTAGTVKIRVHATAINRADLLQRAELPATAMRQPDNGSRVRGRSY